MTRYSGPPTDHFDGRHFHNAVLEPQGALKGFLRWQLFEPGVAWPDHVETWFDTPPRRVAKGELRVSYIGHATVLLQFDGLNILTDPVWAERASPLSFAGPRRIRPAAVRFEDLPPIDIVLVSHNHYDHMDTDTLAKLWQRDRPLIIAPLGNRESMQAKSAQLEVVELDWGQSHHLQRAGSDVAVTAEGMQHWSARGIVDQRLSLWAAFIVRTAAGGIYFAGDTGYGDGEHFRKVGREHGPFRLALLPIGAYEPHWYVGYAHMTPEEAVQAGLDVRAEHVMGHHWATFRLTNEALEEPGERFRAKAAAMSIPSDRFQARLPGSTWWIDR